MNARAPRWRDAGAARTATVKEGVARGAEEETPSSRTGEKRISEQSRVHLRVGVLYKRVQDRYGLGISGVSEE